MDGAYCHECGRANCLCEENQALTTYLRTLLKPHHLMNTEEKYEWFNGEPLWYGEPIEGRATQAEQLVFALVRKERVRLFA